MFPSRRHLHTAIVRHAGSDDGVARDIRCRMSCCILIKALALHCGMKDYAAVAFGCHRLHLYATVRPLADDRFVVSAACLALSCTKALPGDLPLRMADFLRTHMSAYRAMNPEAIVVAIRGARAEVQRVVGSRVPRWCPQQFLRPYTQEVVAADPAPGALFETLQQLGQVAWNLAADAGRLPLSLRFEPHVIAAAALSLASEVFGVPFQKERFQDGLRRVDPTHPFGPLLDEDVEEVSLELLCLLDSYLSARNAETHQ
jgi:hypothetical protein